MADDDAHEQNEHDQDETNIVALPQPEPQPQPEAPPAAERLRAVEDEWLGPDEFRINGEIQKGHGSTFRTKLTPQQHHHHAALEKAVAAEKHLAEVRANLAKAEADVAQAHAAVEFTFRDAAST